MVSATTWTVTSAAIVALTGSMLWAAPSGGVPPEVTCRHLRRPPSLEAPIRPRVQIR